jgi:hypothetical protein
MLALDVDEWYRRRPSKEERSAMPSLQRIEWQTLPWDMTTTWDDVTGRTRESHLDRSVAVFRFKSALAVRYPKAISTILFLVAGEFGECMETFRQAWRASLPFLREDIAFEVNIATPRRPKCSDVHFDTLAAALLAFEERFGSLPVLNGERQERRYKTFEYGGLELPLAADRPDRFPWTLGKGDLVLAP